jgi:hypothetical protein
MADPLTGAAIQVAAKAPWYTWPVIIGTLGVVAVGVGVVAIYSIKAGQNLVGQIQKPLEGGVPGILFGKGGLLGGFG